MKSVQKFHNPGVFNRINQIFPLYNIFAMVDNKAET